MDRKSFIPVAAVAAGACLLVMLTVLIGIFAYQSLVGNAQTVNAQANNSGTDKGPSWTVTPVTWGDANREYLVVVAESDRDFVGMAKRPSAPRPRVKNMAIYRLNPSNNKVEIEFVGARTLEYDLMMPITADVRNHEQWRAYEVEKEIDKIVKKYEKDVKDKDKDK